MALYCSLLVFTSCVIHSHYTTFHFFLCLWTENAEVKLKELLAGLAGLPLSEAEAVSVINLLKEKCSSALDAWHKASSAGVQATASVMIMPLLKALVSVFC